MFGDRFTYDFPEDVTQDQKEEIAVDAGYRFSQIQSNFDSSFYSKRKPFPKLEIDGTTPDDKNRMIEFDIKAEIDYPPEDSLDYTIEAKFQNPKNPDPDLDVINDMWTDCLDDAVDHYL